MPNPSSSPVPAILVDHTPKPFEPYLTINASLLPLLIKSNATYVDPSAL
jgi:hypothetical protein